MLSIIILNYRNRELLKLCLQSISQHLTFRPSEYEILVVDSEAQAETGEMMRETFPQVQYFPRPHNTGYAAGVNFALKKAQGDYLLILNPDIIVTAGATESLLSFLKENPSIGLVGPQLLGFDGQRQNSRFRFYTPLTIICRRTFLGKWGIGKRELNRFHLENGSTGELVFPDWLMGSAMLTRKEAVSQVGLFDERFFLYFEDVDWCKRFWENGYQVVYYPKAVMYHYHQRRSRVGLGALDWFVRREARWHLTSALKYFLKHGFKYRSGQELLKNRENFGKEQIIHV